MRLRRSRYLTGAEYEIDVQQLTERFRHKLYSATLILLNGAEVCAMTEISRYLAPVPMLTSTILLEAKVS